jgi:hypothetical protein
MAERRWYQLRLWVVSAALFLGVFTARVCVDAQGDTADVYPFVVAFQWCGYGAALLVLLMWLVGQAETDHSRRVGCVAWVLLAIASAVAIVYSVPK